MPIRAELKEHYGAEWRAISLRRRVAANWRCEGSPAYPDCRAAQSLPHPVTGSLVVLTVGHRDHDPRNNEDANLSVWCQRCHNAYDLANRQRNRWATWRASLATGDLFEEA